MNGSKLRHGNVRGLRGMGGFSLIELMIVVAIVGIIAAVAFPSYQDSVWKGKRGEAKSAILKALQAEERYYSQSNTYLCYPGSTPCTSSPSAAFPIFSGDNQANSNYNISATAAAVSSGTTTLCAASNITQCVIVTATVVAGADPVCGPTLQMDTVGNKLPLQSGATAVCWR